MLRIVRPLVPLALAALALPAIAQRPDAAISPDRRWRVSICPAWGKPGASGAPPTALWLTDTRAGTTRLRRGRAADDPKRNTVSLADPRFSLDGGFVYVEADAYATSPAIHQVRVATGAARYAADGALVGVLRTGPWRGFLLVEQHRYRPQGGNYDPCS